MTDCSSIAENQCNDNTACSAQGQARSAVCECNEGYGQTDAGLCDACTGAQYKDAAGNSPCKLCTDDDQYSEGAKAEVDNPTDGNTRCVCIANYGKVTGGTGKCVACNGDGQNLESGGVCTCVDDTYTQNTTTGECTKKPVAATCTGEGQTTVTDDNTVCTCQAGYGGPGGDNAANIKCNKCTGDQYKNSAGAGTCSDCPNGQTGNNGANGPNTACVAKPAQIQACSTITCTGNCNDATDCKAKGGAQCSVKAGDATKCECATGYVDSDTTGCVKQQDPPAPSTQTCMAQDCMNLQDLSQTNCAASDCQGKDGCGHATIAGVGICTCNSKEGYTPVVLGSSAGTCIKTNCTKAEYAGIKQGSNIINITSCTDIPNCINPTALPSGDGVFYGYCECAEGYKKDADGNCQPAAPVGNCEQIPFVKGVTNCRDYPNCENPDNLYGRTKCVCASGYTPQADGSCVTRPEDFEPCDRIDTVNGGSPESCNVIPNCVPPSSFLRAKPQPCACAEGYYQEENGYCYRDGDEPASLQACSTIKCTGSSCTATDCVKGGAQCSVKAGDATKCECAAGYVDSATTGCAKSIQVTGTCQVPSCKEGSACTDEICAMYSEGCIRDTSSQCRCNETAGYGFGADGNCIPNVRCENATYISGITECSKYENCRSPSTSSGYDKCVCDDGYMGAANGSCISVPTGTDACNDITCDNATDCTTKCAKGGQGCVSPYSINSTSSYCQCGPGYYEEFNDWCYPDKTYTTCTNTKCTSGSCSEDTCNKKPYCTMPTSVTADSVCVCQSGYTADADGNCVASNSASPALVALIVALVIAVLASMSAAVVMIKRKAVARRNTQAIVSDAL